MSLEEQSIMISAKDLVHQDRHDHLYSKIPNIDESKLAGTEREGKKIPGFQTRLMVTI